MVTVPFLLCFIGIVLGIIFCSIIIAADVWHVESDNLDIFKIVIPAIIGALFTIVFFMERNPTMLFSVVTWFAIATLNYFDSWKVNR